MKLRELKDKMPQELEKTVREQRERLRAMRFGVSVGQETHSRSLRAVRKTIARALTLLKKQPKA